MLLLAAVMVLLLPLLLIVTVWMFRMFRMRSTARRVPAMAVSMMAATASHREKPSSKSAEVASQPLIS